MARLPITKTPKVYVGGAFIRSESGRVCAIRDASGAFYAHIPQCSRKDLRQAVEAAAKAGPGWAGRTAYLRGQILYRLAEMLEARSQEMAEALCLDTDTTPEQAAVEVSATVDRLIHYAGWTDKYEQLLGSVNPVASSHFNFTTTEPMGIVGIIAPDDAPLLGLISLVAPAIVSGNSVVALASTTHPYPAILLGEILAVSDLPGGVINLLTGTREDLLPTFATHEHLRVLYGVASPEERTQQRTGAAESIKRTTLLPGEDALNWYSSESQGLDCIANCVEYKTTWHPVGA